MNGKEHDVSGRTEGGDYREDGVTSAEREELKRLRRENKVLRQERDILSKAAAWFAQGLPG